MPRKKKEETAEVKAEKALELKDEEISIRKKPIHPIRTKKFRPNFKSIKPGETLYIKGEDKYADKTSPEEKANDLFKKSSDPSVQTVFTGTVVGIRTVKQGEDMIPCAIVHSNAGVPGYRGRKIMIAYSDFFIPEASRKFRMIDPKSYIALHQGAEIDFTVLKYAENARYIIGSRRRAALRKSATFWHGVKHTEKGDRFLIEEGQIVEGRIVNVAPAGIKLEVFGLEFFIANKELSYAELSDARSRFTPGEKIKVMITALDRENGNIRADLSYKRTLENKMKEYMAEYAPGDEITAGAVVERTILNPDGKLLIFVVVDGEFTCLCRLKGSVDLVPIKGERVKLKILGMDLEAEDGPVMWGEINHVYAKY